MATTVKFSYNVMRRDQTHCYYKWVSLQVRGLVEVKEKYFEAKYRSVGILFKFLHYDLF